ncbi:MAG: tRNA preQ1(34) S-adenosylmethionine ribosyltransferase-isomerase QueA [Bacteroidota bacterium]
MKLSSFKLNLPPQCIAKYPPKYREQAKLMVVHKNKGKIEHLQFTDIVNFFKKDDAIVLNDSKVFSSKLYGHKEKSGALIETFLLRELDPNIHLWDTIINPARKIRVGNKLYFEAHELVAEVVDNTTSRGRTIKFFFEGDNQALYKVLNQIGHPPLPDILQRNAEPLDKERYQSVYAENLGSTLVPDGSLYFTPYMLKLLEFKDIILPKITLHSSINTLNPLLIQDLSRHTLHSEYFQITDHAAEMINTAKAKNRKLCAVGTPTLKALEASKIGEKTIKSTKQWTNKFIYPPYKFQIVDALLTNFHLPDTVPFINSIAFGGDELIMEAYRTAIDKKYQFFVYGDALLII